MLLQTMVYDSDRVKRVPPKGTRGGPPRFSSLSGCLSFFD